jgi:hypothetical protein
MLDTSLLEPIWRSKPHPATATAHRPKWMTYEAETGDPSAPKSSQEASAAGFHPNRMISCAPGGARMPLQHMARTRARTTRARVWRAA